MTDNALKLIDACCEAREDPRFVPTGGITKCNQAVNFISQKMGCGIFAGMVANQMCDFMFNSPKFKEIKLEEAQDLANQGNLVIAGEKAMPHGHVCVIRPGLIGTSAHWNCQVPKVCNIGQRNFIDQSLNWAFRDVPALYVWLG